MGEDTRETFESPLDDVLRSLSEEAPPPDLERRILNALKRDNGVVRTRPKPPWTVLLKVLIPAAALFALFVAVLPGVMGPAHKREAATVASAPAGAAKKMSMPMAKMGAKTAESPTPAPAEHRYADEAKSDLAMDRVVVEEEASEPKAIDRTASSARRGVAAKAGVPPPQGDPAFDRMGYDARDLSALPDDFEAPAQPWRDTSGERQKQVAKRLDIEVDDVEDAHDRAKSVIEKADGIIVSEDLEVSEREGSESKITAQIPLDQIDGVLAQLRELGKTVKLTGDSVDRTKEYYGRGEDIRDLGSQEDELVAKYEKETNSYQKQQLYAQIQALRQQNKQDKGQLQGLSEQTHSVLLELTLTEKRGPIWFLPRALARMGTVGLWLLVTAIFWGPVALVAYVVWRRAVKAQEGDGDEEP